MKRSWPLVPLGEVLTEQKLRVGSFDADSLPLLGVSNTRGLHRSEMPRIGDMSRYLRVQKGWFAYNPMRINVGSLGWAETDQLSGVISPDYVVFSCTERIEPLLVYLYLKHRQGLAAINAETAGSVRERLYFQSLARILIPLPPLEEQRRIVARIEELAAKISEVRQLREEIEGDRETLLSAAFRKIAEAAPRKLMNEVAPLERRPVTVDLKQSYPQIAVRSFGRGVFHKPALAGSAITWQKPYLVKTGDILISNIKAWEGAIAVTTSEDDDRVGSHRYLTCVPIPEVATARFVCFYLLSPEGLHEIGEASPGSADRNRTLNTKALLNISIPVPPLKTQVWFDQLCHRIDSLKRLQTETTAELGALLPAILDKAFKGKL